MREPVDLLAVASEVLDRMANGGVLCNVVDGAGHANTLTIGWGLIGRGYHDHPVCVIAITPLRYSWQFAEEVPEFVLSVPDASDRLRPALDLCGSASGRDLDKFAAAGLTRVPSLHVRPPSIQECPLNVECRVYTKVAPPHLLLTPEHRQRPLEHQHTIYFAEVLGAYRWRLKA
jgi:flavin reductase (DIM6/NTAB) family NADH-FMN oxidoreductase RutF